jgi:pimeloyl-ACP methyl ester carboxylesterase
MLPAGCLSPGLPDADDILDFIAFAVLVPDRTCAELRYAFGVDHLPLAETPEGIGLPYQEDYVFNDKGCVLRLWYMPAAESRGVVVVSTGSAGPMPCHMYLALLLYGNNWSVVMYDYQGFGGSEGEAELNSLPGDLDAALDWALANTGVEQVTLFGISLGSAPSVSAAVARPDEVNAVILDSPTAIGEELMRFNPLLRGQAAWVEGLLDPRLLAEDVIDQMTQPLLVFLHEEDAVTRPEIVSLIYDRAGGPKQMVRFPLLDHVQGMYHATEVYMGYVEPFLADAWAD